MPILKPATDGHEYINRKGFASINVQMICDHQRRILDVVAMWPGSTHDSRVLRTSRIGIAFENGEYGEAFLLGDSGYPCRKYLMTPFITPTEPHHVNFNKSHGKSRVVIEQTFGILKNRFAILRSPMRLIPERACKCIIACVVLHNIGLELGDVWSSNEEFESIDADVNAIADMNTGNTIREHIAVTYFS